MMTVTTDEVEVLVCTMGDYNSCMRIVCMCLPVLDEDLTGCQLNLSPVQYSFHVKKFCCVHCVLIMHFGACRHV